MSVHPLVPSSARRVLASSARCAQFSAFSNSSWRLVTPSSKYNRTRVTPGGRFYASDKPPVRKRPLIKRSTFAAVPVASNGIHAAAALLFGRGGSVYVSEQRRRRWGNQYHIQALDDEAMKSPALH